MLEMHSVFSGISISQIQGEHFVTLINIYSCLYKYTYLRIFSCARRCIFIVLYLFISNQSTGGWSAEGIIQDNDLTLPVLCRTTHLTSFCVLVSTEEFEVRMS